VETACGCGRGGVVGGIVGDVGVVPKGSGSGLPGLPGSGLPGSGLPGSGLPGSGLSGSGSPVPF
jgi:hypothetical protein